MIRYHEDRYTGYAEPGSRWNIVEILIVLEGFHPQRTGGSLEAAQINLPGRTAGAVQIRYDELRKDREWDEDRLGDHGKLVSRIDGLAPGFLATGKVHRPPNDGEGGRGRGPLLPAPSRTQAGPSTLMRPPLAAQTSGTTSTKIPPIDYAMSGPPLPNTIPKTMDGRPAPEPSVTIRPHLKTEPSTKRRPHPTAESSITARQPPTVGARPPPPAGQYTTTGSDTTNMPPAPARTNTPVRRHPPAGGSRPSSRNAGGSAGYGPPPSR